MADVPFATNLLGAIDPYIATAKGTDLSWIGNLPDSYWAGQNQEYQQRLRNLFRNGAPTNLGDLATQYIQAKGAEGVPEYVSLGNLAGAREVAARPVPNADVSGGPGVSGYTTPGPQTGAQPQQEPPPSPTAGTATLRDIATAQNIPVDQAMALTRSTNPDAPLNFEQRKMMVAALTGGATEPTTTLAGRFPGITTTPEGASAMTAPPMGGQLPPSVGSPSPPAPPSAQVAQAQVQPAPAAASDPQAVLLERTAIAAAQRAEYWRKQERDLTNFGQAAAAKSAGDSAASFEQQARDIRKSLLERSMPTQAAKDVLNPAIRSGAALTGVDKIDAEAYAKDYGSLSNLARSASTQGLSRVEELKTLTTDPNFYSGPFSKGMQSYRQFQSYFGRDPTAATPMEAFNKGVKDILTEQIKGLAASGVGRVNLAEVRNMQGATATLENSPAGNRAQLEVLRRTYLQQQAIGQIAEGVNQEIASGRIPPGQFRARLNQAVDAYAQQNKMFTPIERENPILLGAVDAPADFTRQPLAQARAWGLQRNVHSGDPLRIQMQDGRMTYIKAP